MILATLQMISVLRRIIFSHTVIKFYGHATLLFVYLVAELIIYFVLHIFRMILMMLCN